MARRRWQSAAPEALASGAFGIASALPDQLQVDLANRAAGGCQKREGLLSPSIRSRLARLLCPRNRHTGTIQQDQAFAFSLTPAQSRHTADTEHRRPGAQAAGGQWGMPVAMPV